MSETHCLTPETSYHIFVQCSKEPVLNRAPCARRLSDTWLNCLRVLLPHNLDIYRFSPPAFCLSARRIMPQLSIHEALARAGNSISLAASVLWELDENRLRPNVDYTLDLQHSTKENLNASVAHRPLFRHFSPDVWKRTTFGSFRALLNRYDPRAISIDTVDDEANFICAIVETPCVRFVREWLVANGYSESKSMHDFCCLLMGMWFTEHSNRKPGHASASQTTGFQHVFCGEINNRSKLSGLHNFIRVFLEEQQGNLQYIGYEQPRQPNHETPLSQQHMLKIRFGLHGHQKRISSMFFGVSPEFEVGLYSLLTIAGVQEVITSLGSQLVHLRAVSKKGKILTAYPQLLENESADRAFSSFEGEIRKPLSQVLGKRKSRAGSSRVIPWRPWQRFRRKKHTKTHRSEGTSSNAPLTLASEDVIDLTTVEEAQQTAQPIAAATVVDLTTDGDTGIAN